MLDPANVKVRSTGLIRTGQSVQAVLWGLRGGNSGSEYPGSNLASLTDADPEIPIEVEKDWLT